VHKNLKIVEEYRLKKDLDAGGGWEIQVGMNTHWQPV